MVLDVVATGYMKERTDKEAVKGFRQRGTMSVYLALQERTERCTTKERETGAAATVFIIQPELAQSKAQVASNINDEALGRGPHARGLATAKVVRLETRT